MKKMDEKIWERIYTILKTTKDADIANFLGIKRQSVGEARRAGKVPPAWLIKIAEKTGASLDWLVFGQEPIYREHKKEALDPDQYVFIPLLESRIVAGPQGEILYENVADHYPFKRWWIEKLVGKNPERHRDLILFRVAGDSMTPTINPGEVVLVDTGESERINIRNANIYVIRQPDGGISLKRVVLSRQKNEIRIVCLSDNPAYTPFEITVEPERDLKFYILGRVRWTGKELP